MCLDTAGQSAVHRHHTHLPRAHAQLAYSCRRSSDSHGHVSGEAIIQRLIFPPKQTNRNEMINFYNEQTMTLAFG